jgi:predicted ribosome quality control (RQC) complex YloA/Tae2 family protein
VATCFSDGSDDSDDESSHDEKKAMKKAFASITISNKPSLFGASSTCLMAKPTKVQNDSDDDSCASDDCRFDDEEEDYSKDELMEIYVQLGKGYKKKSKECKGLEQELKAIRKSFDELQTSHECLKKDHEELLKKLTLLYLSLPRRRRLRRSK